MGLNGIGMPEISYVKVVTLLKQAYPDIVCQSIVGGYCTAYSVDCIDVLTNMSDYQFNLTFKYNSKY